MAKCDFKAEPRIKLLLLSEGPDPDHMRLIGNTSIRAQACEVREGNGAWHFTRIGPFSTPRSRCGKGRSGYDPGSGRRWSPTGCKAGPPDADWQANPFRWHALTAEKGLPEKRENAIGPCRPEWMKEFETPIPNYTREQNTPGKCGGLRAIRETTPCPS